MHVLANLGEAVCADGLDNCKDWGRRKGKMKAMSVGSNNSCKREKKSNAEKENGKYMGRPHNNLQVSL